MRPSLTEKVVSPIRVYNDRSFPRLVPFIGGEMFAMEFESSTPSRASVLPKLSSTSPFAVMCRFTSTRPSGPLYPVAGFKGTLEKKSARPPTVIHSLPFDFPCFHVLRRWRLHRLADILFQITRISRACILEKSLFIARSALSTDGNDASVTGVAPIWKWLDEKLAGGSCGEPSIKKEESVRRGGRTKATDTTNV